MSTWLGSARGEVRKGGGRDGEDGGRGEGSLTRLDVRRGELSILVAGSRFPCCSNQWK
jgi:hypothetical protein